MSQLTDLLAAYLEAELKILKGQRVMLGDKRVDMADLQQVRAERKDLERRVAAETTTAIGGGGLRYTVADFSV